MNSIFGRCINRILCVFFVEKSRNYFEGLSMISFTSISSTTRILWNLLRGFSFNLDSERGFFVMCMVLVNELVQKIHQYSPYKVIFLCGFHVMRMVPVDGIVQRFHQYSPYRVMTLCIKSYQYVDSSLCIWYLLME